MNGVGIKKLNSGLALNIKEFVENNCFFILDLSPEQCNNSHLHSKSQKKTISNIPLLKNFFFSFTDSKTGVIGIDIKFDGATSEDYQLLA